MSEVNAESRPALTKPAGTISLKVLDQTGIPDAFHVKTWTQLEGRFGNTHGKGQIGHHLFWL